MPGLKYEPVTLSTKQSNIYDWGWQDCARHRVAVCGRRFGKTFLIRREMKRAAKLVANRNVPIQNELWYGAPTFKQAKRVFWRLLKRSIPSTWIDGKPNESECSITLKTGHVIRIVGLDNYDDLRGSGLFFFVGDEWADCNPLCWTEVIRPMLGTCGGHSLKIGTPKGFNHFHEDHSKGLPSAKDSEGQPITDHRSWTYTSIQGGNIPEDEIAAARRDLDPRTFSQEYNATFESYAGQVLYAFKRTANVRACPYDPTKPIHIGMDFNVNPMSATIWQETEEVTERDRYGKPLVKKTTSFQVGEIIIPTSNTDEMCAEIKRRFGRVENGRESLRHITIYPDPAGAQNRSSAQGRTDISILRANNFRVLAMSSHPLVRDRINETNARFLNVAGEHQAFVDPSCTKSIQAYERLEYKEGTNEPDKNSGYDHPVDATGYYMYVRFAKNGMKLVKVEGL